MRLFASGCAFIVAALAAAVSATPPSQADTWRLGAGSIVYESHRDDRVNIHRYDAGAASPVALTTHRATDQRPRWSPDGSRVAFHSDLRGNNDVYVINADGSGLERITDHGGDDSDPDWMPDGRLLFSSDRDGDQNIYLLDLETSQLSQLTHYEGGRTGGPTAAGNGRRIAFSSDRAFSWQVYVLDLRSGEIDRITGPIPGKCNPAWSPRDDRIAFMSGGDLLGTDLRSTRPDGGDTRSIGSGVADNQDPQFSEDGSRMVWVSDRHGNFEIFTAAGDGADEVRVSATSENERHPDLFLGRPSASR